MRFSYANKENLRKLGRLPKPWLNRQAANGAVDCFHALIRQFANLRAQSLFVHRADLVEQHFRSLGQSSFGSWQQDFKRVGLGQAA